MILLRTGIRELVRAASVIAMAAVCPLSPLMGLGIAFCHAQGSLTLEISSDKTEFLVGEPIWVDVTLRNSGSDTLVIPHRIQSPDRGNLAFLVATEDDTLNYSGPRASFVPQPQALGPGEGITRQHDLIEWYGSAIEGTKTLEMQIAPGEYSVQARAFVNVVSNAIDLVVIEPTGDEADLHRALHEAYLMIAQRRSQEAVDMLDPLLASASRSAYRDKLYFTLILIPQDDSRRWVGLAREFLNNYPDSRYSRPCLLSLFENLSRTQAEAFIHKLESKFPGTRGALQGRELLQTYEFKIQ